MHEMALVEGVMQIVLNAAREHAAARVLRVRLRIGALSCVAPEALRFCFDVAARNTAADGATLDIVPVPGTAWCAACQDSRTIRSRADACPTCGSAQLLVTGGDDLAVQDLEIA